jgi:integrase
MKPNKTTFGEYLDKWLKDYAKPNLSPRGYERYQGIITKHLLPELGNIPLMKLKPEHLQTHYTSMLNNGLSPGTVKYHHAVIHKALQTAVMWRVLSINIADAVSSPRVQYKEMNTWDEDDIVLFLEGAKNSPYYALFYTALFTGMRRSELLALRWSDVDFIFSQIYVNRSLHQLKDGSFIFSQPKSAKSSRTIALSPSLVLLLQDYKEQRKLESVMLGVSLIDDNLVFSSVEGKPIRPNTITRAWNTLVKRCGLKPIRFHDARHTHASIFLKQGIHPKIVQERLGHSSIIITLDTYSHVAPGLQEAAASGFDKLVSSRQKSKAVENR